MYKLNEMYIYKLFDEDLDNNILLPIDYIRIIEMFNKEKEEEQNGN